MILFLPHKGIIGSNGLLAPRKVNLALIYIYYIYIYICVCFKHMYTHTYGEHPPGRSHEGKSAKTD